MFYSGRLLVAAIMVGFSQTVVADKPVGAPGVMVCDGVDTAEAKTLRIDPADLEVFLAEGAIEGECPPGTARTARSIDQPQINGAIIDRPIRETVYHVY